MISLGLVNIYNDNRIIYIWHRVKRELRLFKDDTFFPYFYNPSSTGTFKGLYGERLTKLFAYAPYEIPKKRTAESREADIIYTKRYLIDRINITKAEVRYIIFDIETKSKNLPNPFNPKDPITFITCYDNYLKDYVTFDTRNYVSEYSLVEAFINYVKERQPDLLIAYNAYGFDYPYLYNRVPDFVEKISPIGKVIKKNNFPAGISMVDYYDLLKKVYKYKKYTLEFVYCDTFKLPYNPQKYTFDEISDTIKEKNIADVRKIVELESKLKLISHFDELRRISKAMWEDLTMYSVLVDGLMLQVAKDRGIILPTKPQEEEILRRKEEDEIIGGYVHAKTGLFENVHLFDVGGTYPNLIVTFNLDPANKRLNANDLTTTIRGIHINQNSVAIVPSVANKLINSRKAIQVDMQNASSIEEKDLLKQKDDAHKSLNNSLYGVLLFKSSRIYDKDIAGIITFLARYLIRYTKYHLRQKGFNVIYCDTDSIFVHTQEKYATIESMINDVIIPKWLNHFNKKEGTLKFKYEGTFKNLFIVSPKHYIGTIIKSDNTEKEIIKGVEVVRSDASKFQEVFQTTLYTKIRAKETKEQIEKWIESEVKRFKTLSLTEIAFPCKLSKERDTYKTETIHVRALRYAQQENPNWEVNIGQDFYYTYIVSKRHEVFVATRKVKGESKEIPVTKEVNVMAFDEFNSIGSNEVDWVEMIRRNIYMKADTVFEAMGWKTKQVEIIKVKSIKEKKVEAEKKIDVSTKAKVIFPELITHKELAKQFAKDLGINDYESESSINTNEETITVDKEFKVLNAITERTIQSAEAFGLGIDKEEAFVIYRDCKIKYKQGDVIFITGDSGSGKSWILKNIFAKLNNSICIEDIKVDDEEVMIDGVGKDISDALAKLNVAGLGDAFLYLRKYNQLSDGQKYRYKIAKFINNEDKDVWILDEFCATLDRVTAKVIAYNLQKVARKLGKTVVCATTHNDLLEELRPDTYINKGYESDVEIKYYPKDNWKDKKLEFYKDMKVEVGTIEEYEKLKRFHYRQATLGARKCIYRLTYKNELIGVIAICYPHLALKGRNIALNNKLAKMTKENCKELNDDFDSIARVIIHPKFRGIGLAQYFLQEYFKLTPAKYAETVAVMSNYNPFFAKAGMTRIDVDTDGRRETSVKELEQFGFDVKLISSMRYVKSVFDKLSEEDKEKVRDLVITIINKYKGASHIVFAKINKNPSWKEDLKADDNLLFEYFKQLRRSNTVYSIIKLRD